MLYPFKFKPILLPKIWGGRKLKQYFENPEQFDNIGESWTVSALSGNESEVVNGRLASNTLSELVEVYLNELVGDKVYQKYGETFPLLVKIIDSKQDLSIQVHPNNQIAQKYHNCYGKNEAWYILDCEKDAFIYAGFNKKVGKEEYKKAVENDKLLDLLNKIKVEKGDIIYVPSGCVHSIGAGCVILEIQQPSDITYRIFDFNRKDSNGNKRELHLEKALESIDFENTCNQPIKYEAKENLLVKIVDSDCFSCSILAITQTMVVDLSSIDSFVMLSVVDGNVDCIWDNGKTTIEKYQTVLVPASFDKITLSPSTDSKVLLTHI